MSGFAKQPDGDGRRKQDEFDRELAKRREDGGFQSRLKRRLDEDAAVLKRLKH